MRADEQEDWDWKYESWREEEMVRKMDSIERLKARNTFEAMVRRLQYALDEQAELKRHKTSMEKGLFDLKMKRTELCVKSARRAVEAAKEAYKKVVR